MIIVVVQNVAHIESGCQHCRSTCLFIYLFISEHYICQTSNLFGDKLKRERLSVVLQSVCWPEERLYMATLQPDAGDGFGKCCLSFFVHCSLSIDSWEW